MAAIVLNGTSSSGKTSIARAVQKLSPEPFLHLPVDGFLSMFNWDTITDEALRKECTRVAVTHFHKSLPALLAGRFPGIIDHVFLNDFLYENCIENLGGQFTLFVGVHCPLEILKSRESARGDRSIGIAEAQFDTVHKNRVYDLEVDTGRLSPEACASAILTAFHKKAGRNS